ncbi:MAG: hypothetical protein FJX93_03190 [Bacteroidetes bacterium]|nr:hypothetical protein [Bacteroidota bacterium]
MSRKPTARARCSTIALLLATATAPKLLAQSDLVLMAELCRSTQPQWTDTQRDSAWWSWTHWGQLGAPRSAEALAFLAPDQQFALERYQAQFGWPRDSTEWRALPLSPLERELLQRLYHSSKTAPRPSGLRTIEPAVAGGWNCSDCLHGNWGGARIQSGLRLAFTSSTSRWSLIPWGLKSRDDAPLRGFWHPDAWGLSLNPGRFASGAPDCARWVDRVAVSRGPSFGTLGEVLLRSPTATVAVSGSSRGWWLVSGTWYGPGGLLVSAQRERYTAPPRSLQAKVPIDGLIDAPWERPAASATPWRALRGNRATAALPLWAGRLTLAQTSSGRSASWANSQKNASWTPGQLSMGQNLEVRGFLPGPNTQLQPERPGPGRDRRTPADPLTLRATIYVGRANGASLQLRRQQNRLQWDVGVAALTAREAVLPRALGPMGLWRPGTTVEAAVAWLDESNRLGIRLRSSPSGWSASLSAQCDLAAVPRQKLRETAPKSRETTWPPPRRP